MLERNIPAELLYRRSNVRALYKEGYGLVDMARYFEVPVSCIKKSIKAMNIHEPKLLSTKKTISSIENQLRKRDELLVTCTEADVYAKGFWRVPKAFSSSREEYDDVDTALQKELRSIGIRPKEILEYMNGRIDKLVVSRPQNDAIFEEQKYLGDRLIKEAWLYKEIIEFCGISIGHLMNRDKKEKREKNADDYYDGIKEVAISIFDEYVSDPAMTHQTLAEKYGLSRRTVITYINEVKKHRPDVQVEKRFSNGNKQKRLTEEFTELLRTKYLEKNASGVYQFKKRDVDEAEKEESMQRRGKGKRKDLSRYTIESVAQEMGVTEVTIVKYLKRLNEDVEK